MTAMQGPVGSEGVAIIEDLDGRFTVIANELMKVYLNVLERQQ